VLNNAGNHYLICGQPSKAERYFEQLLKLNPAHPNANLQLARLAADRKQGTRALQYLSKIQDSSPAIELLRAEASASAGLHARALRILDGLRPEADADPRVGFALGIACARMGLYDRAEAAFNRVLAKRPDDFDVLFNLGRAAARAQHYDRAQRALDVALKLRPNDVDALFELGRAHAAAQDYSRAVFVLAQARQRAPKRPDILLALARAAEDAGYYGDSALAYDEYLQIQPDDTVRRDRARVYGYTVVRLDEGLKELAWYVQKHPDDPIGYYDLAQFSWVTDPQKALDQLSTALRLDPRFVAARYNRAWLLHRLGRTAESLPDLQVAVQVGPKNVRALDQLGLTYLSLDQPAAAEKVLRQALAISPKDPEVLMHLGRALIALDREEEAQSYLETFQKVRPRRLRDPRREAGMIELATLPVAERTAREIKRLRQDARSHPGDPELQLRLALLLLVDGQSEEAAGEFRTLLTMNADSRIWAEGGAALVGAEQYALAREFLERALAETPAARLDLAIALFFTDGPKRALQMIDTVPEGEQAGDYLLMKARILDAAGQSAEAEKVLQEGLRRSISRPHVAQQAALLLLQHHRPAEAQNILGLALQSNPQNADLILINAIALALMGRNSAAERALKEIELRWPEWDRPYVVHGLLLERGARPRHARQKLQTAIALGSQDPAGRCALARLATSSNPDPQCACRVGLYELLFPSCDHR
jgi:tetratricopeptide (TPR) repeat protein